MDPVQITMLGATVALAALIVTLNGSLRRDIDKRFDAMEKRFDDRFDRFEKFVDDRLDRFEKRLEERFDGIEARMRSVDEGLAGAKGRFASVESYTLGRAERAAGEAPAG